MTEAEWLGGADPQARLNFLGMRLASKRKRRLLAVACCRMVADLLVDPESRRAVQIAELFADGRVSRTQRAEAFQAADDKAQSLHGIFICGGVNVPGSNYAAIAAAAAVSPALRFEYTDGGESDRCFFTPWEAAARALAEQARENVEQAFPLPPEEDKDNPSEEWWSARDDAEAGAWLTAHASAEQAIASLVRDVLGNPFRRVQVDPSWLAWNDGIIPNLARGIYDENAFDRMGILADALEEAGCTDSEMLTHCRQGGGHIRGCWVVDQLLGRS
jgi:hypothetical protein